jgi:23S rRNA (cytidine1920-2'-O)/16S rRNA (cytidine1409-2'-O)-methyltransferase
MAVVDASFISLATILPHVAGLLKAKGEILCLVKPQFEAPREAVDKGGIVTDETQYQEVIQAVVQAAHSLSLRVIGIMESPITGRKGNREFFIYLRKDVPA